MWTYDSKKQLRYGDDDLSYQKAAAFLDDGPVEDWGCGCAYAKRFFTNEYRGIDGAAGFADVVTDLCAYTSRTHGILLRHVLEHNFGWREILTNALSSAEKVALIIFTPFSDETKQVTWNHGYEVPDISFRKEDLTDLFQSYTEETFESKTLYGTETIFYIRGLSEPESRETHNLESGVQLPGPPPACLEFSL